MVKHKLKIDHIIPKILSRFASSNINLLATAPKYAKLDIFLPIWPYLVELHIYFLKKILKKY